MDAILLETYIDAASKNERGVTLRTSVKLRRVDPEQFSDLMIEQDWIEERRRLPEILEAMDLLFHQVWYNRHQLWRHKIERGEIKLVEPKND